MATLEELRQRYKRITQYRYKPAADLLDRIKVLPRIRQFEVWRSDPSPYVRRLNNGEPPVDPVKYLEKLEKDIKQEVYKIAQEIANLVNT